MNAAGARRLLAAEFPQAFYPRLRPQHRARSGLAACRVRLAFAAIIRPGGTISGPTMMALADFAMYVAAFGPSAR